MSKEINLVIQSPNYLFIKWLILAILAIGGAGFFSIILVLLRIPQLHKLILYDDFFKTSLIVHVNLSVIIWFFTIQAAFTVNYMQNSFVLYLNKIYYVKLFAIILIIISPFLTTSTPHLNNYVPILNNVFFITGFSLYFGGYILLHLLFFISTKYSFQIFNDYNFAFAFSSSLISMSAIFAVYLSYKQLIIFNEFWLSNLQLFYEYLFWAGGHLIQFMFLTLGQFAWIYFLHKSFTRSNHLKMLGIFIFYLNAFLVIIMPYFFLYYPVNSGDYILFYTQHMKYFGGASSFILLCGIVFNSYRYKLSSNFTIHFLIISFIIFIVGGVLGFKINYSNTEVPAHYHGVIVSITIALMGIIYIILKKYTKSPISVKLFVYQAYIYGVGQLLHILGLAFSGGYGALRKTPGGEFPPKAKIYLAFIGLGGIIAMIGGAMFIVLCYKILVNLKKLNITHE